MIEDLLIYNIGGSQMATQKGCIVHDNRASKKQARGNPIPKDQNEVSPEVSGASLRRTNPADGRAPGAAGGK